MKSDEKPKRTATRRAVIAGLTSGVGVTAFGVAESSEQPPQEIARTMESIHQEVQFKVTPDRIYEALTNAKQFQKVVLLSGAMQSGMIKATPPAQITAEAGGAFAIFGGFVTGRQIELVPNVRIVQAWRPADWAAGVYSIARFELAPQGSGTLLVFEHTGFPKGAADHLAQGWKLNYWQPLEKVLL
jgi:activator of HSP90 ATPase